ncbi:S8 family peptidase [Actinoalloteichus spitiensis]|uniref:S8 family peptidase n=1 Tax=Actinoalloteichus spitiensis TaxID=252394 RepID=UPI0012F64A82|nr:S8 family serine peptidase [Actinoalloteichus spitiensis]
MSVALAVGCCVVDPTSASAAAPGHRDAGPGSCAAGGTAERYLVVFPDELDRRSAEARITEACGTTVAHYHQIGVAVATSSDPAFDTRLTSGRAVSAERSRAALDRGGETRQTTPDGSLTPGSPSPPAGDVEWNLGQVGADQARRVGTGPEEVVVGVLDSGVDPGHPALTDSVDAFRSAGCLTGRPDRAREAWTPSTSPHGTHVAGIIAATGADGGPTGVAPGVRIASVKVVDDDGYIYPEYVVCGLMWAASNGMDITNNSYLVDPWPLLCDGDPGHRVAGEAVRRAVRFAEKHGVLTVAAVGNDGVDLAARLRGVEADGGGSRCSALPAEVGGVLTVGSVGPAGVKARASSYGYGVVDVVAPGGDRWQSAGSASGCVNSTVPGGRDELCGTSMAAPHASGVAALLASHRPGLTPPQLRGLVRGQASPVGCPAAYDLDGNGVPDGVCTGSPYYNSFHGAGLVNALAAVGG